VEFDFITCLDVVYQLERPVEAYREAARCLRPGGALVVNEPAYRWLWSYMTSVSAAGTGSSEPKYSPC